MKRLLLALLFTIAFTTSARATQIVDPHIYQNGETLDQTILNPPLTTLYNWANGNVDNTNIGSAGIYASQVIPTSVAQATFGGGVRYTFANGLLVSGGALTFGTPNTTGSYLFIPNASTAATSAHLTQIGSGGSTVSGVTNQIFSIADQSNAWVFGIDQAGNVGALNGFAAGASVLNTLGVTSAGNVQANNGVFAAPAGKTMQFCPNAACSITIGTDGTITSSAKANFNDVTASRGNGTGVIFLGGGTHYLYFDGSNYQLPSGGVNVGGGVSAAGAISTGTAGAGYNLGGTGVSTYMTYGSNAAAGYQMYWGADGGSTAAGVNGSGFRVGRITPSGTNLLSLDQGGNLGIVGTYYGNGGALTNLQGGNVAACCVAIAAGGNGTASPGLVAGTNISITGSWPNQTVTDVLPANVVKSTNANGEKTFHGTIPANNAVNTAPFSSASSYDCSLAVSGTTAGTVSYSRASGTSFTVYGTAGQSVSYLCVGT